MIETIVSVVVFDRWGGVIIEQEQIEPSREMILWDGTMNGSPLTPGVYTFALELLLINGRRVGKSGTLTLIR